MMKGLLMIAESDFKTPFFTLFAEIFGVSDNPHGFILDDGRSGLIGTIAGVDAARASSASEGTQATLAAHVNHVLFILNHFLAFERGETPEADWAGSWRVQVVDDAAWDALRTELRTAYETVAERMTARAELPPPAIGSMMMLLAHCAYHVGEIRQRLLWLA